MTDLNAIIEKLGRCGRGDRALDREIAKALGLPHGPWEEVHIESRSISYGDEQARPFTRSVDAALTLIPDGWRVTHAYWDNERAAFTLAAMKGDESLWREGRSATPALALCIAALKARAA